MNIQDLIPKDKFDIETAQKLQNYSFEEVKPIIPNLLEWLQDLNWPVSKPVFEYMIPFTENISLEILQILQGKDEVWKYWILQIFGNETKNELVVNEIRRIARNPTEEEINEGIAEIATEITQM